MCLVKHDNSPLWEGTIEHLRVFEPVEHRRQVAVQVHRLMDHPNKRSLSGPPHARQPDDGPLLPGGMDALDPVRPLNHETVIIIWSSICQLRFVGLQIQEVAEAGLTLACSDWRDAVPSSRHATPHREFLEVCYSTPRFRFWPLPP